MVRVQEVPEDYADDELWLNGNNGNQEDYSDEEEEYTQKQKKRINSDDDIILKESLFDRMTALQDIISFSTRKKISQFLSSFLSSSFIVGKYLGHFMWSVVTSTLIVAVPTIIGYETEMFWNQIEADQKLQGASQQFASSNADTAAPVAPAQTK